MKKWMSVLLTVFTLAVMTGCGSSEKVIEKEQTGASQETVKENSEEVKESDTAKEEASVKGYVFKQQDVVIEIDAEAAAIIDALGEPISYFEAASCAFEGLDKMYTYNSFQLDTYPMNDVDYVSSIVFKDDSIATAEGVSIGETRAKVEDVYGTDYEENGSMLVYHKDGMKLCFILEGDSVASIEYVSTVLDE